MNRHVAVVFILGLIVASPTLAWDPLSDVTKAIRDVNKNVAREASRAVVDAAKDLENAKRTSEGEKIAAQKAELESAQRRAAEIERQTQIKIEERALVELEKQLPGHRSIAYGIDNVTLTRIIDSLYAHEFEVQPRPFQNVIFVHTEPRAIGKLTDHSELIIRLVVYWRRAGERIDFRYSVLEKRLRSPDPRETADPLALQKAEEMLNAIINGLGKERVG